MKLQPNENRLWDASQVKAFVKRAIDKVGERGWDYLSYDMKEALLAQQSLRVVASLDRYEIDCASIYCLQIDMMTIAGMFNE